MKKFVAGIIGIVLSFSLIVFAGPGGDTFPWGAELPFPWKDIQGSWSVEINDVNALVTFRSVRSDNGFRQLKITIFDPSTCKVIAVGAGYEENRIVKGVLTGAGKASKVTVHVFRESDMGPNFKHNYLNMSGSTVTIMSFAPINSSPGVEKVGYELHKLNNDPKAYCQ